VRSGSLERALTLAGLYDVEMCVLWYLLLAWALKEQSRCEEARETLEQLQHKNLPRLSDWQGDYAAYLLTYVFEISEDVFLALHKQILDWRSHLDLCKNLTERGYFTIALSAAQSIDVEWARIQALGEVAVALARAGDFTTALNTIDELLSEQKKLWLGKIVVAIAVVGNFDIALSTAQQIHDKAEQAKALGEIAKLIAIAGDKELSQSTFNTALKTALSINNTRQQVRLLWEIAKSIAIAGNTKIARSTLDTALEITQLIAYHQQHEREYELGEIAAVIAIA
jgi:tetratricopeptide (TPR) repeat protein